MNSTDRVLSTEALIGICLALVLVLVDPEQPGWRILILASLGLVLLNIVRKNWGKRKDSILTLTGEFFSDDEDTFLTKLPGYVAVVLFTAILGFATWPHQSVGFSGDVVVLSGTGTPPIQYNPPSSKGIVPSPPLAQVGANVKKPVGQAGIPGKGTKPPVPVAPRSPINLEATVK
jgi:hypothetical protein